MSSLLTSRHPGTESVFGAGGHLPYDRALLETADRTTVRLVEAFSAHSDADELIDVASFTAAADPVDLGVLGATTGATLDLGCGPGRMVEAAVRLGRPALGVDLSSVALELAARRGAPVLSASVFDPLPDEGRWDTVLLLDGNIGIGGDPDALLRRTRALVRDARDSRVVVEASRHDVDRRFDAVVVDVDGCRSSAFPWAQLGSLAIARVGARNGFGVARRWRAGGRRFVAFAPC